MISILYEQFKKWSERGSIYLISDLHFSDVDSFTFRKNNGKLPEGINTVEELDELQIKNINAVCHKCDTLILLGDVGNIELVKRLKAGYKVLLTGNHDRGKDYYMRKINHIMDNSKGTVEIDLNLYRVEDNKLFDEVYTGPLMISDKVILSHEPIIPCPSYLVNLCGHVHAKPHKFNIDGHDYYNFCAEAIDYVPISLGKLIKNGLLSKVDDIHRVTIDGAIVRKAKRVK